MGLNMALDHVNNNPNNSKMSFDKIKSETLTGIKPYSCKDNYEVAPKAWQYQKVILSFKNPYFSEYPNKKKVPSKRRWFQSCREKYSTSEIPFTGKKLAIARQWVRTSNRYESHLIKA
jgi:hypothetical protein